MPGSPFVIGAYASMPPARDAQRDYYALLGEQSWIAGAELPYPGDLAQPADRAWLADHLPRHWRHNVVTLIPGTMQALRDDSSFGLASPDPLGRAAAIEMLARLRDAIADLAALRGRQDVIAIELHTAPTRIADATAMVDSLKTLARMDWMGARLVIEHCDRYVDGQSPEKGFLPIDQEIELARAAGIGVTVNWGRSAIEGRSAQVALEHVYAAARAGLLGGLMFSGAGPDATQYGYPWIDGHLPMRPDEPTSLMGADAIRSCVAAAGEQTDPPAYVGAKVCVPREASLADRLACLSRIHDAVEGMRM